MALSAVVRSKRMSNDLFWSIERADRVRVLAELVSLSSPAVVFTRSDADARRLAGELSRHGVPAAAADQRDFASTSLRARVLTDETAAYGSANRAPLLVHFDPALNVRRYRRRHEQVGTPESTVVTMVVPERRDEASRLLARLDANAAIVPADVETVRARCRAIAGTESVRSSRRSDAVSAASNFLAAPAGATRRFVGEGRTALLSSFSWLARSVRSRLVDPVKGLWRSRRPQG